eukprot:scaffold172_cov254-Pinguiococcus_pyrenoidosus.AAC.17
MSDRFAVHVGVHDDVCAGVCESLQVGIVVQPERHHAICSLRELSINGLRRARNWGEQHLKMLPRQRLNDPFEQQSVWFPHSEELGNEDNPPSWAACHPIDRRDATCSPEASTKTLSQRGQRSSNGACGGFLPTFKPHPGLQEEMLCTNGGMEPGYGLLQCSIVHSMVRQIELDVLHVLAGIESLYEAPAKFLM